MKIIIKTKERRPKVTIDLKDAYNPYVIRDSIRLALEIDGFTKETIAEIFNELPVNISNPI